MGGSLRTSIQALLTGFNLDEILSPGLLNLISLVITIAIILLLIKIAFKFINGLTCIFSFFIDDDIRIFLIIRNSLIVQVT